MISKEKILSIVTAELSNSDTEGETSFESALDYYLGNTKEGVPEGRSKLVSTDVADAIEWIMPQIMKSFTQNNEIVIFDPVHEGDENQAELESEYIYDILMKQNDGFILMHQFVKDALMQRFGVLKVYYAKEETVRTVDYTGLNQEQLEGALSVDEIDVVERTEYVDQDATLRKQEQIKMQLMQMQQQLQSPEAQQNPEAVQQGLQQAQQLQQELEVPVFAYDVKLKITRSKGQIYVESVPPEEFRINSDHNSINTNSARFTAHVTSKTASDVMKEYGLSKEKVMELPLGEEHYRTAYRFDAQNATLFYDESEDDSQRKVEVSECFMDIDIDDTGIAQRMKITVVGNDDAKEILSIEEIEENPWVTTTAILMSHKFQGLSIVDRIKELQDNKTALVRNMMDNMYLQNNQRNVVVEGQVNLDDLLVSRPGGIIRSKRLDAVAPLPTPQLGADAYNMLKYLDSVRAGRTGVEAEGPATPEKVGERVGSEGVDRLMNAKEELVGLIVRVIAETGIKPLCFKIRELTIKHIDTVHDYRFRGVWHKIKPYEWLDRTRCTIRVGTGTGDRSAKVSAITAIIAMQEKVLANPSQTLLKEEQVFAAFDDFCKFSGLNGATKYFLDPTSPQGQENAKQIQQGQSEAKQKEDMLQAAMVKSQADLAQAELGKAQAQIATAQAKAESEYAKNQLKTQELHFKAQLDAVKQELEEAKAIAESVTKDREMMQRDMEHKDNIALELTRIEATSETEQNANFESNRPN